MRTVLCTLSPLFARHGIETAAVIDSINGVGPSALGSAGALKLDHLESFVRSAYVHGRIRQMPRQTLESVRLVGNNVSTDGETADYLVRLAMEEAVRQTSIRNTVANAVVGRLTERALRSSSIPTTSAIADMTDRQFWQLLEEEPATSRETDVFLLHPERWRCTALEEGADVPEGSFEYRVPRLYLDLPYVDGRVRAPTSTELEVIRSLQTRFAVSDQPEEAPVRSATL